MNTATLELPKTASTADRPVDLVHLSRVTFGDRALEREVLGLFLRQSTIQLDRLKEARTAQAFGAAAHTLKGSAAGIGARHVAAVAAEAEALSARYDTAEVLEAVARLEARVVECRLYISQLLSNGA
ncbi:Hpt domain-containing protein [Blastochloris sulfoviridis]|uniref:Hpt domain-containing protein n=1 Tax=Blastochloris sulfoviridis TaxID=50712 RepID=A0A5M6HQM7_9HYPH|nr:Hpt domain-containing protein [Blastochloris sulfoviridis]KAA5598140.1 Hpt domain-containing protein [Blastochloris sulfoviridis]